MSEQYRPSKYVEDLPKKIESETKKIDTEEAAAVELDPDDPAIERTNNFPEFIGNPPLEATSFVYSIPVSGEWNNGQLLRTVHAVLSQRTDPGQAFEVEFIANIGPSLYRLEQKEKQMWGIKKDSKGNHLLITHPETDEQKKAWKRLQETDEAVSFLKKIIEAQALARRTQKNPDNKKLQRLTVNVLQSVTDPLQREVLELAMKKSATHSVAVVDATRTNFDETAYQRINLSSLRTLGADMAMARFGHKPDVVLGMYDADTVPETNTAVQKLQQIFLDQPRLQYLFTGVTNLPSGHSVEFVADSPRDNIRRTDLYNAGNYHGSPQICFRLQAYEKLQELAGWTDTGFHGDEDRDTAARLIYHFGNLQDGLLFDTSAEGHYPPTALTADRLDGAVDSMGRATSFQEHGVRDILNDVAGVREFQQLIADKINAEPVERQGKISELVEQTRAVYEKKEKIQQRMNRRVLRSFVEAVDRKYIDAKDGGVAVNEEEIVKLSAGTALLHYIRANRDLVETVVGSPDDLSVMRYFSGLTKDWPLPNLTLSPFQAAIREYVGEALSMADLERENYICIKKDNTASGEINDLRQANQSISLMHGIVAESLALGHVYRALFSTRDFLASRDDTGSPYEQFIHTWPKDPDKQDLDMHFGAQGERVQLIKDRVPNIARHDSQRNVGERVKEWFEQIDFESFPLFGLYKALTKKDE